MWLGFRRPYRHCERSEAIQTINRFFWIAASAFRPPRNDGPYAPSVASRSAFVEVCFFSAQPTEKIDSS